MVHRTAKKCVKNLPFNFKTINLAFTERLCDAKACGSVPDQLIINWDQTGINYAPVSEWTMEVSGSKQVPISYFDDKRQMTVLLACTMAGNMLPAQCIYQGKSDICQVSRQLGYYPYQLTLVKHRIR